MEFFKIANGTSSGVTKDQELDLVEGSTPSENEKENYRVERGPVV
jgi:hypothetical protein